jgi:uncharacterized damage-inducible protein DinB
MNAQDILKYGHNTVLQAISDLSDDQWLLVGPTSAWTVKDVIAHLASYEWVLVDVLQSFIEKQLTPKLDEHLSLGEKFNDVQTMNRKSNSKAEVLAEYNSALDQVMSLVPKLTPENFTKVGTLPWYGNEYSLDDYIVYQFYGHKREHSGQINQFKNRLKKA